jgi:hypothetical protein
LDALWLLIRYRASLEADVDFTDVSEVAAAAVSNHASNAAKASTSTSQAAAGPGAAARLEAALRATAAAQDACAGGAGGKEPVRSLDDLQGNEVGGASVLKKGAACFHGGRRAA